MYVERFVRREPKIGWPVVIDTVASGQVGYDVGPSKAKSGVEVGETPVEEHNSVWEAPVQER